MTKSRVLYLLFFFPFFMQGQEADRGEEIYTFFDEAVGLENTDLLNGLEYIEQHITINEKNKFLNSSRYLPGTIIYKGQPYYNINMNYNIYDDLLLVRIKKRGGDATFQLHNEKVNGFRINGKSFINTGTGEENAEVNGFYEILSQDSNFTVLKKHQRVRNRRTDGSFVYFEFENKGSEYAYSENGNYHYIASRRQLSRNLPQLEDQIRAYYPSNRALLKADPDTFMINLFRELSLSRSKAN